MYKVLIVDDEPLARKLIASLLKSYTQFSVVGECSDGFEAFKMIQATQPDLVFLDVQMPKLSGFEMLELLDKRPAVIFCTAFDAYAIKAFEANAIDYMLKPLTKERFDKGIQKWLQQAQLPPALPLSELIHETSETVYQHRIVVKDNGIIRIIPTTDIQYIEASDDYVKIVTAERTFLKKTTMSSIEASLDPVNFVRVHRSYIIPVSQIAKIEPYEKESHIAKLQCGAKILISKSGMIKLKQVLGW
jgi:two-component system LytT family response regulator